MLASKRGLEVDPGTKDIGFRRLHDVVKVFKAAASILARALPLFIHMFWLSSWFSTVRNGNRKYMASNDELFWELHL
jgi:hypothetical protein